MYVKLFSKIKLILIKQFLVFRIGQLKQNLLSNLLILKGNYKSFQLLSLKLNLIQTEILSQDVKNLRKKNIYMKKNKMILIKLQK